MPNNHGLDKDASSGIVTGAETPAEKTSLADKAAMDDKWRHHAIRQQGVPSMNGVREISSADKTRRMTIRNRLEAPKTGREPSKKTNRKWAGPGLIDIVRLASALSLALAAELIFGPVTSITGLFLLIIVAWVIANTRIRTDTIRSDKEARIDLTSFMHREALFVLLATSGVFLSGLFGDPRLWALYLIANSAVQFLLFGLLRFFYRHGIIRGRHRTGDRRTQKAIILGSDTEGRRAADIFLDRRDLNVQIIGFVDDNRKGLWRYRDIPLMGTTDDLHSVIAGAQVDFVIPAVRPDDPNRFQEKLTEITEMGLPVCFLPHLDCGRTVYPELTMIGNQPLLMYRPAEPRPWQTYLKKIMDRAGALIGLILTGPFLLMAAAAIKLDSKGPVFFRQKRTGQNGRTFDMIKLRTMVDGADDLKENLRHLNEMSGPVFKIKKDPRITRVGRILRKFSLDEFPQFFNILRGDMSLVGPRPPLPDEVARYESWQRRRLSVKPGATCLWQISGRNSVDFDGWMNLDLLYIDTWSLHQDIRILLRTIPAVIKGTGAS